MATTAPMNEISVKRSDGAGGALDLKSEPVVMVKLRVGLWFRKKDTDRFTCMSTDRYTITSNPSEAQRMSTSHTITASALRLFYQQGYHASGVEQLSLVAGVTKKTLYRHFPRRSIL